jgi:hypothetical protein
MLTISHWNRSQKPINFWFRVGRIQITHNFKYLDPIPKLPEIGVTHTQTIHPEEKNKKKTLATNTQRKIYGW